MPVSDISLRDLGSALETGLQLAPPMLALRAAQQADRNAIANRLNTIGKTGADVTIGDVANTVAGYTPAAFAARAILGEPEPVEQEPPPWFNPAQAAAAGQSPDDVVRGELEAQLAQAKEALAQREAMNAAQAQKLTDLGKKPDDYQRGAYMALLGLDTEGKAPKQGGRPIPTGMLEKIAAQKDAISAMRDLGKTIKDPKYRDAMGGGRLGEAYREFGQKLGWETEDQKTYNALASKIVNVTAQIRNALYGAGLTGKEIEFSLNMLPSPGDPPETAEGKIQDAIDTANRLISTRVGLLGQSGYNAGGVGQGDDRLYQTEDGREIEENERIPYE